MDPVALALSGTVLVATLLAAVRSGPRPHAATVAVPGAVLLALVGAVGWPDAEQAVREIAPSVARCSAVGLATVPLTLGAATVALWAALHV